MRELMGNYFDMISALSAQLPYPLSFLSGEWTDADSWRAAARAAIAKLLSYDPVPPPMDARAERIYVKDGVICEHISYAQPFGPRTEGVFLRPEGARGKLPGVLALHDHGGFKYFGKEKIAALEDEHPVLAEFKRECYGGRSWANELAGRGYCVFAPDLFLWGSRRQPLETLPEFLVGDAENHPAGSAEAIGAYNDFIGGYESVVAKSLFLAGASWPGVMVWDDRRALDYLASRPEVDAARIGCGGLSGGGNRTIFLSAMDDRVAASFCAGFMCTFEETAKYRINCHTWMFHLPGLAGMMDLPDVQALHGPKPTMVLYDEDDPLWTLPGQARADEKLKRIFAGMGAPEGYLGRFYPGGHKFDIPMQEDAFAFLDAHLKREG